MTASRHHRRPWRGIRRVCLPTRHGAATRPSHGRKARPMGDGSRLTSVVTLSSRARPATWSSACGRAASRWRRTRAAASPARTPLTTRAAPSAGTGCLWPSGMPRARADTTRASRRARAGARPRLAAAALSACRAHAGRATCRSSDGSRNATRSWEGEAGEARRRWRMETSSTRPQRLPPSPRRLPPSRLHRARHRHSRAAPTRSRRRSSPPRSIAQRVGHHRIARLPLHPAARTRAADPE